MQNELIKIYSVWHSSLWEYPRVSRYWWDWHTTQSFFWLHHKLSFYSELSSRTTFLTFFSSPLTISHTSPNKLKHHSVIIVKITQLWHIFLSLRSLFWFLMVKIWILPSSFACIYADALDILFVNALELKFIKKCTQIYCYRLFEQKLNWFFST